MKFNTKDKRFRISVNEYQAWWQNGERHRLNGPAVIYSDGSKSWYQNGRFIRSEG